MHQQNTLKNQAFQLFLRVKMRRREQQIKNSKALVTKMLRFCNDGERRRPKSNRATRALEIKKQQPDAFAFAVAQQTRRPSSLRLRFLSKQRGFLLCAARSQLCTSFVAGFAACFVVTSALLALFMSSTGQTARR